MLPAYRTDGPPEAPLLVLSNSLGTTADMWAPQLPALTNRFRVVRYEHRGHGGSAAPPGPYSIADLGGDLVALLDHLGAPSANLCGLSLGGMSAMWVAAHHPGRVSRLVVACAADRLPPAASWTARAAMVRRSGPGALLDTLMTRWFTPPFTERGGQMREAVAAMLAAADPEGYASCCEAIAAVDLSADLGRITAPTLVIGGALDPVTPPQALLTLQTRIPGSALTVIPRAAHLANLEAPHAFTTAIIDHLADEAAVRGDRVRREVLGDDHVDRSLGASTSFSAPFFDFITRYAWGEVWTRPGLDRRTRSSITVAMLASLGRFDELALHLRAALGNGLSHAEIGEILLQIAVYCGVPVANSAFAVAQHVFSEPQPLGPRSHNI